MIHFKLETFDFLNEMLPLLTEHVKEVYWSQDIDIDTESYKRHTENGSYIPISARTESGELIGYAGFFIKHHLHFKTQLFAYCDIIYMKPTHRGLGHLLIKFCDEFFNKTDVKVIMHYVTKFKDYSPTLISEGYNQMDTVYFKQLK